MMDKGGIVKTINGLLMKDTRSKKMMKHGHECLCLELSVGPVRIEWVAKLTGLQLVGNWNNQLLHCMTFAE